MATRKSRTSDAIVAELQELGRKRDALRETGRGLQAELQQALIAEGKAVSPLATADLRDPEQRAALRAKLDEMED